MMAIQISVFTTEELSEGLKEDIVAFNKKYNIVKLVFAEDYPEKTEDILMIQEENGKPNSSWAARYCSIGSIRFLVNRSYFESSLFEKRVHWLLHEIGHHLTKDKFPSYLEKNKTFMTGEKLFQELYFLSQPVAVNLYQQMGYILQLPLESASEQWLKNQFPNIFNGRLDYYKNGHSNEIAQLESTVELMGNGDIQNMFNRSLFDELLYSISSDENFKNLSSKFLNFMKNWAEKANKNIDSLTKFIPKFTVLSLNQEFNEDQYFEEFDSYRKIFIQSVLR